ncbi:PspA/IM30 family protein [Trichocoleus sp. FACHB-46]|nr:PspA/IM30 family protein [Trichocoleus sp. FACHB-46]
MAAGGAVVGLGLVGLNRLLQQGIDPEKLLDNAIEQMEADSQKARQAVIQVVASQKRLQQQYGQAQAEANQEPASIKNLKRNLILLDGKIAEAKMMRTSLKARIAIAKVNGQLPSTASQMSAGMPMGSFTRREEEVLQMEARSQAAAELAGADLEDLLDRLESGSDVDDELAAMKEALLQPSQPRFLPASPSSTNNPPRDAAVDEELEELKRQLDSL